MAGVGCHPNVGCDRSGMYPIVGMRYNLRGESPSYDLCQAEFDKLPDEEKRLYDAIPPPEVTKNFTPEQVAGFREIFDSYADGADALSKEQMTRLIKGLIELHGTDEEMRSVENQRFANEMCKLYDINGDGKVTFEEMLSGMADPDKMWASYKAIGTAARPVQAQAVAVAADQVVVATSPVVTATTAAPSAAAAPPVVVVATTVTPASAVTPMVIARALSSKSQSVVRRASRGAWTQLQGRPSLGTTSAYRGTATYPGAATQSDDAPNVKSRPVVEVECSYCKGVGKVDGWMDCFCLFFDVDHNQTGNGCDRSSHDAGCALCVGTVMAACCGPPLLLSCFQCGDRLPGKLVECDQCEGTGKLTRGVLESDGEWTFSVYYSLRKAKREAPFLFR